jgi:hypothetical protein
MKRADMVMTALSVALVGVAGWLYVSAERPPVDAQQDVRAEQNNNLLQSDPFRFQDTVEAFLKGPVQDELDRLESDMNAYDAFLTYTSKESEEQALEQAERILKVRGVAEDVQQQIKNKRAEVSNRGPVGQARGN